jgi:hypothetical protein
MFNKFKSNETVVSMLDSLLFVLFFLLKKNTKRVVFGFLAEKKATKKKRMQLKNRQFTGFEWFPPV